MNGRIANPPADKSDRDMLDVLVTIKDEDGNPRFSADEITGMFISMMFAGHHTSSGTASWTLIELLRHPDVYAGVIAELEELYSDGGEVSFHALRQIPRLENVLKETLRLHPPLIILMRVAKDDFEVCGYPIHKGDMVAASPAISNRIAEDFPDPDSFVPDRYEKPRQEDLINRWTWIPFGAGRHRCVGAAFATMQIKAIFSVLLREYEFEMAQPSDSYHNDHSKMVVQLAQPAKVRYRRRTLRSRQMVTASKSTWTCARATPCASWRRPTTSRCPNAGRSRSSMTNRQKRTGARSNKPCGRVPRKHYPSEKRKTDMPKGRSPARNWKTLSSGGWRPTARPKERATGGVWRTSTPTTPPTAGTSAPRRTSCASASTRSATSRWDRRWRASRAGSTRISGCSSTTRSARSSASGSRWPPTADGTESEIYGIGGSWFRYAGNGKFDWQRDFFDFGHVSALYMDLIKAGKLSEGMQKRIERGMSRREGARLLPAGQEPGADLVVHTPGPACDPGNLRCRWTSPTTGGSR